MAASGSRRTTPAQIVRRAQEQVQELFGKELDSVSAVARDGSRGWTVTLELVELPRIPDTTSLLGTYEARLDAQGDLIEAKRVRRYARNQVDPVSRKEES